MTASGSVHPRPSHAPSQRLFRLVHYADCDTPLQRQPKINPMNGKAYSLAIFNLRSAHTRAFHLSWLGFFVAFLSWFAFSPLTPEIVKEDLGLTNAEIGESAFLSSVLHFTALSAKM